MKVSEMSEQGKKVLKEKRTRLRLLKELKEKKDVLLEKKIYHLNEKLHSVGFGEDMIQPIANLNILFKGKTPLEIIEKAFSGGYHPKDEYFHIDGVDDIITLDKKDIEEYIELFKIVKEN